MKKVFIVLIFILLCGCTSTYELDINNGKFKENINIIMPNEEYTYEPVIDPETGVVIEDDNQYQSFIDGSVPALFYGDSNYEKKVVRTDENININLKYNYSEKEFSDSYALHMCFDNSSFSYNPTYHISLSGYFYCLYSDSLDIVIKAKGKVISNNADEVVGSKYIWHISNSNRNNVNINFEVEKNSTSFGTILIIVVLIVLGIVSYFVWNLIKKRNERNNLV